MRIQLILLLIITALLFSACGKKGPVRPLPQPAVETQKTPVEESEKKPN